ncbi:hypothetical protein N9N67_03065 [Bacteriovoracaceae bacterium]|nr:hypothetical protein [Bacteriovoracaceae bacterium]
MSIIKIFFVILLSLNSVHLFAQSNVLVLYFETGAENSISNDRRINPPGYEAAIFFIDNPGIYEFPFCVEAEEGKTPVRSQKYIYNYGDLELDWPLYQSKSIEIDFKLIQNPDDLKASARSNGQDENQYQICFQGIVRKR